MPASRHPELNLPVPETITVDDFARFDDKIIVGLEHENANLADWTATAGGEAVPMVDILDFETAERPEPDSPLYDEPLPLVKNSDSTAQRRAGLRQILPIVRRSGLNIDEHPDAPEELRGTFANLNFKYDLDIPEISTRVPYRRFAEFWGQVTRLSKHVGLTPEEVLQQVHVSATEKENIHTVVVLLNDLLLLRAVRRAQVLNLISVQILEGKYKRETYKTEIEELGALRHVTKGGQKNRLEVRAWVEKSRLRELYFYIDSLTADDEVAVKRLRDMVGKLVIIPEVRRDIARFKPDVIDHFIDYEWFDRMDVEINIGLVLALTSWRSLVGSRFERKALRNRYARFIRNGLVERPAEMAAMLAEVRRNVGALRMMVLEATLGTRFPRWHDTGSLARVSCNELRDSALE